MKLIPYLATTALIIGSLQMITFPSSAQVTDLTDAQYETLQKKHEGDMSQDPALDALIDNASTWKPTANEEALSFGANTLKNLLEKPARYRGQLFNISGTILNVAAPTTSSNGIKVSTVILIVQFENQSPSPVLLLLTNPDERQLVNNSKVTLYARYYKPIATDAENPAVPAFVGHSFQSFRDANTPVQPSPQPRGVLSTQPTGSALESQDLSAIHAAGVTALTESQKMRLDNAHEGHISLENSAFYALSENARTWTNTAPTGFFPIPYSDLMNHPGKYRGMPYLIKGRLLKSWEVHVSRDPANFKRMRQWQIAIEWPGFPDGRIINVFLTDPPEVSLRGVKLKENGKIVRDENGDPVIDHYESWDRNGTPVELVARFYKNQNLETRREDENGNPVYLDYPCFIGMSATVTPEESSELGAEKYVIGLVIIMLIAFAFAYFWNKKNKSSGRGSNLREEIARRRHDRYASGEDEEEEYEEPENLPKDPLAAMEMLNHIKPEKKDPVEALKDLEKKPEDEKTQA